MKMKALQSFHTKETRTVHPESEFEVSDALGREFEQRGLAEVIGESDTEAKAEPELENKMEPTSLNRFSDQADNKTRRRKTRADIREEVAVASNAENEAEQEAAKAEAEEE